MGADTSSGIQVRVAVEAAEACPVAAATGDDGVARSVTWTGTGDDGTVVEEFDLVGGADADDDGQPETGAATDPDTNAGEGEHADASVDLPPDATVVFDAGDRRRVRFERDGSACICDRVESEGVPVTDVTASHGTLRLTFHATDVETVRAVIEDLTDAYGSVRVDRLSHTGEGDVADLVLVDRGRLTGRQREVLETALEMGYFERPREANATEVAAELDIAPSTFAEHLASAQSKVLDSLLDGAA